MKPIDVVTRGVHSDPVLSCTEIGETTEIRLRSGAVLVFADTRLTVFSPPLVAEP
jgi:hypothetical protein